MAMSTLMDRFSDPEYVNWVKLSQALLCVRDGLAPFCEGVIREIHVSLNAKLDSNLQGKTCTVGCCTVIDGWAKNTSDTTSTNKNKEPRWSIACTDNICNTWLGVILKYLLTKQYAWKNCDVSKWPTEPWQLGKLCMDYGQEPSNAIAAKTETMGMLQLIINCKTFHLPLGMQESRSKVKRVTSIRNKKLFHSKDFTVEDDDLDEYITDMMNLLQSGELANDSSAQEAVRDLQKVKDTKLDISDADVLKNEQNLWKCMIEECIRENNENKENIVKFISSQKDLLEGLHLEVDQLKTEVKQLQNRQDKTEERVGKNEERFDNHEKRFNNHEDAFTEVWASINENKMNIMQHQEMKNKEASQTPEVNVLRAKLQENSKVKENISQQRNAQVREDTARPGDCIQRTVQRTDADTPTVRCVEDPRKGDAEQVEEDNQHFKRYDVVTIEKNNDTVKQLQEDLGIWQPSMASVIGMNGIVDGVNDDGVVFVEYSSGLKFLFNPKLLEGVDTSKKTTEIGDFVLVIDDSFMIEARQDKEHGGWVETMRKNLGSTGIILSILPKGCAKVFIRGRQWTYNLEALRHIARSGSPTSNTASSDDVSGCTSDEHETFSEGGHVRVDSDESTAIRLQNDIGGWTSKMKQYLGKRGVIKETLEHLIKVQFDDGEVWHFNRELLHPVEEDSEQEDQNKPFKRYDVVSIAKDKETAMVLQEGHGGWVTPMASVLGLRGYVLRVIGDGDVLVKCINQSQWCLNPKLLEVVDTSKVTIKIGDFVLVNDSYKKLKTLQDKGHGGWVEGMRQTLGSAGTVVDVLPNGCARVVVSGRSWVYNLKALKMIARCDLSPFSNTASWGDTLGIDCEQVSASVMDSLLKGAEGCLDDLLKMFDMSSQTYDEKFGKGDKVRVDADEVKAIRLQIGHGSWNDEMKKYLGKVGTIEGKLPSSLRVQFSDGRWWAFNKELLHPVDTDTEEEENRDMPFKRYDIVRIEKNKDKVISLQEGHGGWKSSMVSILGKNGIVNKINEDGDIVVEFANHPNHCFNPKLLTVTDTSNVRLQVGDTVLVINSYETVKALQDEDHGGWIEKMREALGSAGIIMGVLSNGRARIFVGLSPWVFNMKALRLISKSDERESADESDAVEKPDESDAVEKTDESDAVEKTDESDAIEKTDESDAVEKPDAGVDINAEKKDITTPIDTADVRPFSKGDKIRVETEESKAINRQKDHGLWTEEMKKYLGKTATVKDTQGSLIKVQFSDGKMLMFDKALLHPIDAATEQDEERIMSFKRCDIVCVEKNKDRVVSLQKGHGDWRSVLGKHGIVRSVNEDGDVFVEFENLEIHLFNPKLLTVIDTSNAKLKVGDTVLVIDSYETVKALQDEDCVGWSEKMRETLGSTGTIHVWRKGRAKVFIDGHQWVFNIKALRLIPESDESKSEEE